MRPFPWSLQAASYYQQTDDISTASTTFDVLLKPAPDAGFAYTWVKLSDFNSSAAYQAVSIDGSAPCCIPLDPVADRIFTDNTIIDGFEPTRPATWRPAGASPQGDLMGSCNITTGIATFTWYGNLYNISLAQGSGDAQVLIVNSSANSSNPPSPPGRPVPFYTGCRSTSIAGRQACNSEAFSLSKKGLCSTA